MMATIALALSIMNTLLIWAFIGDVIKLREQAEQADEPERMGWNG